MLETLALLVGIVCVITAWVKRRERWAATVFWIGVVLLVLPPAVHFLDGLRDGLVG